MKKKLFENKNQSILFFGSIHGSDKGQIKAIKEEIDNFKPTVVLVEGDFDKVNFDNEEEAIKYGFESGFTAFYCKKKGIPITSNDPIYGDSIEHVRTKFDKDIAYVYFVLADINQGFARPDPFEIGQVIRAINDFKESSNWDNYGYSIDSFLKLMKDILKVDFKSDVNYEDYYDPSLNLSVFNEVSKVQDEFRDTFMIKKIKNLLTEYDKVFIIKGDGHFDFFVKHMKETL